MCIIRLCEQSEAIQPTLKQSGLPRRSAPRKDDAHLTQHALALFRSGAPDGIRTHGPQIRNLVLYPAELRVRHAVPRVMRC
jgi:hypothetical protein